MTTRAKAKGQKQQIEGAIVGETEVESTEAVPVVKVSLSEAQRSLEVIDELIEKLTGQVEDDTRSPQERQDYRDQLKQMLTYQLESMEDAEAAITRMLNRASWQTQQKVAQDTVARYHRGLAAQSSAAATASDETIRSIKQAILSFLLNQGQQSYKTQFHKMHLSTTRSVAIDWEQVPGLEGLIALNTKYPGIVSTLKFNESGVMIDVTFRLKMIQKLIEVSDDACESDDDDAAATAEQVLSDLCFARIRESKYLVVPTISETAAKRELNVVETEYGLEAGE